MKAKKLVSMLLAATMVAGMVAGCGGDKSTTGGESTGGTQSAESGGSSESGSGEIKEFTAFFAVPGDEINDDNEIQQQIADLNNQFRQHRKQLVH